jgi:hypothetical protein
MNYDYADIRARIPEPPIWWDEYAVPRYVPFAPGLQADIYAQEVALLEIACQACGELFQVAMSWSFVAMVHDLVAPRLAATIQAGQLGYGDPPNNGCCGAGASMTSNALRVLEYWARPDMFDWIRDPALEIALEDGV